MIVLLISPIFLKRSLVFPILLFSSISLHWSLRKALLFLLGLLWNSAFRWIYLSFSPLPLASLLFTTFVRPPQTAILLFCISFSWGWSWSLSPVQCHKPLSIVLQTLCLSDLIPGIYLSLSLYNIIYKEGTAEDEIVGWHHRLDGHEFEQVLGLVLDREAWRAAVHGVT